MRTMLACPKHASIVEEAFVGSIRGVEVRKLIQCARCLRTSRILFDVVFPISAGFELALIRTLREGASIRIWVR